MVGTDVHEANPPHVLCGGGVAVGAHTRGEERDRDGDAEKRDRLQARLSEFIAWLDRMPTPVGVREAVALRKLKIGPNAVPPGEAGRRALEEFRNWFREWLPQVLREAT